MKNVCANSEMARYISWPGMYYHYYSAFIALHESQELAPLLIEEGNCVYFMTSTAQSSELSSIKTQSSVY